jgi:hypothetical protein
MVQQLMGDFIQGWLVQYHKICRAGRQSPHRYVAKKSRHPTGNRLQHGKRQAGSLAKDTATEMPTNPGAKKWPQGCRPQAGGLCDEPSDGGTPQPFLRRSVPLPRGHESSHIDAHPGGRVEPQRHKLCRLLQNR